jgi:hypothetical protein
MTTTHLLDHLGLLDLPFALEGVAPSALAAVALLGPSALPTTHLGLSAPGLHGCILVEQHQIIHAELRATDTRIVADQPGYFLWTGPAALRAMALLLRRAVEITLAGTREPVTGHAPNLDCSIAVATLEMAVTLDEGRSITTQPCAFVPGTLPTPPDNPGDPRSTPTRRPRTM